MLLVYCKLRVGTAEPPFRLVIVAHLKEGEHDTVAHDDQIKNAVAFAANSLETHFIGLGVGLLGSIKLVQFPLAIGHFGEQCGQPFRWELVVPLCPRQDFAQHGHRPFQVAALAEQMGIAESRLSVEFPVQSRILLHRAVNLAIVKLCQPKLPCLVVFQALVVINNCFF